MLITFSLLYRSVVFECAAIVWQLYSIVLILLLMSLNIVLILHQLIY